jgi:hypothetical protein
MAILQQTVRLIRQKLNKIEKGIDKLAPSRELSLSKTNIQEAQMFLGLVLGDIGEATPYPKSDDSKSPVIEARADVSVDDYNFDSEDHVGMVKEIRKDIADRLSELKEMYAVAHKTPIALEKAMFFPTHMVTAVTQLEKSKLWSGMELGRIKLASEKAVVDTDEKSKLAPTKKATVKKKK